MGKRSNFYVKHKQRPKKCCQGGRQVKRTHVYTVENVGCKSYDECSLQRFYYQRDYASATFWKQKFCHKTYEYCADGPCYKTHIPPYFCCFILILNVSGIFMLCPPVLLLNTNPPKYKNRKITAINKIIVTILNKNLSGGLESDSLD